MAGRAKVVVTTNKKDSNEDCYVPGCYVHATKEECPGIPKSNRCASCRKKKNYLGGID